MQILVTAIDPTQQTRLGYTQLPSFMAKFEGAEFSGSAWFVPASGKADGNAGQTLEVELSQERVTQVTLEDAKDFEPRVQNLSEPASYRVTGFVDFVTQLKDPIEACIVYISVGNANFTLTTSELGGIKPVQGGHLSFTVHGLSLWDEAI